MLSWTCHEKADGLAVHTAGPANGQPVVLLHGFFQDGRIWATLLDRLPEAQAKNILWVAPDLPGHGRSSAVHLADLGMEAWPTLAELLDRSLQPLLPAQPLVVGYSFGGRAAAYWMAHSLWLQRLGLRGALLESAHPGLAEQERPHRRSQDADRAARLLRDGTSAFAHYWSGLELFASQRRLPNDVLAHQEAVRRQQDAAGLADHLLAFGTGTMPLLDGSPAPLCQTVLLVGGQDLAYAGLGRRWQRSWPAARLVEIARAGHNVHLECPDDWWRQVWQLSMGPLGPLSLD